MNNYTNEQTLRVIRNKIIQIRILNTQRLLGHITEDFSEHEIKRLLYEIGKDSGCKSQEDFYSFLKANKGALL